MNGSRRAATIGGRNAFRTPITADATTAPSDAVDVDARDERGRDQQRARGDEPREHDLPEP